MAQIVVNSEAMRRAADDIQKFDTNILVAYDEVLTEVKSTASKMRGVVIDTEVKNFENLRPRFEEFNENVKKYAEFLRQAAAAYEETDADGLQRANEIKWDAGSSSGGAVNSPLPENPGPSDLTEDEPRVEPSFPEQVDVIDPFGEPDFGEDVEILNPYDEIPNVPPRPRGARRR